MAQNFAPHVPNAAQQAQLATLQAAAATAQTAATAARKANDAAKIVYSNAQLAVAAYQAYINGGLKAPGLDEGSADTV